MNEDIAQEIVHEMFSSLEALETQSAAILQFLKDKKIASEEELAPYFNEAGNASNVRWLAARVRIDRLISSAMNTAGRDDGRKGQDQTRKSDAEPTHEAEDTKEPQGSAAEGKTKGEDTAVNAAKKEGEQAPESNNASTASRENVA
jgi:hypothetical protein